MDSKMVGQRIKEAREAANMTQEELGKLVEMDKQNISRLEKGYPEKYIDRLNAIAAALNCDLEIFFKPKP